jgi:hypothetical protein
MTVIATWFVTGAFIPVISRRDVSEGKVTGNTKAEENTYAHVGPPPNLRFPSATILPMEPAKNCSH